MRPASVSESPYSQILSFLCIQLDALILVLEIFSQTNNGVEVKQKWLWKNTLSFAHFSLVEAASFLLLYHNLRLSFYLSVFNRRSPPPHYIFLLFSCTIKSKQTLSFYHLLIFVFGPGSSLCLHLLRLSRQDFHPWWRGRWWETVQNNFTKRYLSLSTQNLKQVLPTEWDEMLLHMVPLPLHTPLLQSTTDPRAALDLSTPLSRPTPRWWEHICRTNLPALKNGSF